MGVFGPGNITDSAKVFAPGLLTPKLTTAQSTTPVPNASSRAAGAYGASLVQVPLAAGARLAVTAERALPVPVKSIFGPQNLPLPLNEQGQYQPQGMATSIFGPKPIGTVKEYGAEATPFLAQHGITATPASELGLGILGTAADLSNPAGSARSKAVKEVLAVSDIGKASELAKSFGIPDRFIPMASKAMVDANTPAKAEAALKAFSRTANMDVPEKALSAKPTETGILGKASQTSIPDQSRTGILPLEEGKSNPLTYRDTESISQEAPVDGGNHLKYSREGTPLAYTKREQAIVDSQKLDEAKTHLSIIQDALSDHPGKRLGNLTNWRNGEFVKGGDTAYQAKIGQEASGGGDLTQLEEHRAGYEALKAQEQEAKDAVKQLRTPPARTTAEPRAPESAPVQKSSLPNTATKARGAQETVNKVERPKIEGTTLKERVRSAIGNSEMVKTQVVTKGQDAYTAGKKLNKADLALAGKYEEGTPISELAKQAKNPGRFSEFMHKMTDYYDYRLAVDRAVGGDTSRVENYIPHQWDLSNPADKARFDEMAKQKGLQTYYGFKNQSRVFKSYAEGEALGFKRANPTILGDLRSDFTSAGRSVSSQSLRTGLKEAAPDMVGLSGEGRTAKGEPFKNSNAPGLEGISFHPEMNRLLKGFEPLNHPDFIKLVKESGAEAAITKTGIKGAIEKAVAELKSVPKNASEAGFTGVAGSIYDHVSSPLKELLWNWSGFHSINITLNHMGASVLHPITGAKGVLQSVGSVASEHLYNASIKNYKNLMTKEGISVYDWAVKSGAFEARDIPATGLAKYNPFTAGKQAIFGREIPILQLNLAQQMAKKGISATSPQGRAIGKEIRLITGEINGKTMNINPNTLKNASRVFLAPGFTISKYKTILDSVTKFGKENGAAGNLARTAVIGKSAIAGTMATLVTLLATGKFPNLQQVLLNATLDPTSQTNLTNPKGQVQDIVYPKTFVSEPASAVLDPTHYAEARLNPLLSDFVKGYTNKDWYGRPIVDPNSKDSVPSQYAKGIGLGHLPIGGQAIANNLLGKQSNMQTALNVLGLRTKTSASDPTVQKYKGIDDAISQISQISGSDPQRVEKMQAIFNALPPADRKSVAYRELLAGVKTKGVYTSEVERKYFEVQDMVKQGKTAEATAITKAMTPAEYKTYKSIKTRLTHQATYQQVQDLVKQGKMQEATAITSKMTKQEYSSYQTWKKNNP